MAGKRASGKPKSPGIFGHPLAGPKPSFVCAGILAFPRRPCPTYCTINCTVEECVRWPEVAVTVRV
jgi:hypothetical protein